MKKFFATLGFALIPFFSLNAVAADAAAPMVCNAAETAKVCRDYDPKKQVLGGPASDKFIAALDACAGPLGFDSPRYNDCQNNAEITTLRAASNAESNALRAKFAFMDHRCSPDYAKYRVCGPSVDKQVQSPQPNAGASKSGSPSMPTLTRVETNKVSAEQIANTRKAAESNRKREAAEAADRKAKEATGKANAQKREDEARAMCMKPSNRHQCGCGRFYPQDTGGVCGK